MTTSHPDLLTHADVVVLDGPFTMAERDAVPENGYRHELLDGVLVMSASPRTRHQDIVVSVFDLLREHLPSDLKVLFAPFDVRLGEATAIQPDIVVMRRADVAPGGFTTRPVLCVEVASPSTRMFDLGRKKDILAEVGCPSYWTIEPAGPELTIWELRDGAYVEVARVGGDQPFTAAEPFPVTIVASDLLDD